MNRRQLAIVCIKSIIELLVVSGMDCCFYFLLSLIEECEGLVIAVIVYEDYLLFC